MALKFGAKTKKVKPKKVEKDIINDDFVEEDTSDTIKDGSEKKAYDSKNILIIGIACIVLIAIVVAAVISNKKSKISSGTVVETVVSKDDLKNKLKEKNFEVDIIDPVDSEEITYSIENDGIAKLSYKKKVSDDVEMNFVLRVSSSTEEIENSIGLNVEFPYEPIMMTVVCEDGSEIPVESKVAVDGDSAEMKYMKSLWFDNDKYYSMVTDNLVTREDFLQEVNRVIIANHIPF